MYSEPLNAFGGSIVSETLTEELRSRRSKLESGIRRLQFVPDLVILVGAFALAYLLRFDFDIPAQERFHWLIQLPCVVLVQFAALQVFGIYKFIWRYVGMAEVNSFLRAACFAILPILTLRLATPQWFYQFRVPLSVIIMNTILAFGGVLALRVLRRTVYEAYERHGKRSRVLKKKKSVLLIGAGRTGMLAAKEIQSRGNMDLEVKGFIDKDSNKIGSVIQGVKVLGTIQSMPRLIKEMEIDHVVITIAQSPRQDIRQLMRICEQIPIKARIVPGLHEIVGGNVEVSPIRDLQIEDLLGREPVHLDEEGMRRFLVGKTVMVTGAGGSIGSELARQVARFQPFSLLLVERAEFSLFDIDRELRETWPDLLPVPLVADVGDEARMRPIFTTYHPQVVLHAAAHKHVPMMEANISEVVKNNILATNLLGELAGTYGAEVFVLISTDKAVRPTSVMGASKRVAELVAQNLNQRFETRYAAVRFGNVIGSAGSVIPIFRGQIRKGGPLTVTHPDMMRYFMTIPEAARLVLQAGTMTEGGEIFILDMGEPVRILDLAKDIITLSGLKPFEDIDIVFTGVRPGEKLFEELQTTDEHIEKTRHPKIFIGKISAYLEGDISQSLRSFAHLSSLGRERELRRFLNDLLPEANLEHAHSAAAD
jgi:FlaA1/EpsC-like NDP-sugar epimerase